MLPEINGNLAHPGIVPVYGMGAFKDGRPYYAMRFIEGDSLKETIDSFHRDEQRLDATAYNLRLRQLLGRFVDVCDAMAYAHSRRVLHRDLKPANVMLGQFGETLIIDWGLAKSDSEIAKEASPPQDMSQATLILQSGSIGEATVAGRSIGTPAYMSPEQAEGNLEALGPTTDVYGLGATLHALLTGVPPVEGDSLDQLIELVSTGRIRPPRSVSPRIPAAIEAICLIALANNPEDRYATARLLAEDIECFLADEPVTARRDPIQTRVWRWIRKRRTLTTTAAAALIVGVIAMSIGWTREAQFANQLATTNQQLRESNEATGRAEQLADGRLDLAMSTIKDYFTGVNDEALKGGQIPTDLRNRLLTKPQEFYRELTAELAAKDDPSERELELLADGQLNLGDLYRVLRLTTCLGPQNKPFANHLWNRLDDAGLAGQYQYLGSVDRDAKLDFLSRMDVCCVPTEFLEPKGLYVLEALAAGVPVVLPAHGAFPELVQQSGGGLLFEPGDTADLATQLARLLDEEATRRELGNRGQEHAQHFRNAAKMADATGALVRQHLPTH